MKKQNKKVKSAGKMLWLDYDQGADVLYVHFSEKSSSNHSEMREDGIILDYRDKELVGLTIVDASQRERILR